jgi:hypothetical protein
MHYKDIWQGDDREIGSVGKTMHSRDEWNNLIFELCGHAYMVALEDTRPITTNAHQLSN